ncbi:hypothetical protein J7643_17165 [bacterium]|nr:hypothetical protein [bacterium]
MKQHLALPLAGLSGLVLLGCATVRPGAVGAPDTHERTAVIELTPRLEEARHVQAIRPVYKAADIASLSITPYVEESPFGFPIYKNIDAVTGLATDSTATGVLMLTQASPSIAFNKKIRFANLKPNKRYRVIARAYNMSNTLISDDVSSQVNLPVLGDETLSLGTLPIKLMNTVFAASTSVRVLVNGSGSQIETFITSLHAPDLVPNSTQLVPGVLKDFYLYNLKPNTTYRVEVEARKSHGGFLASGSTEVVVGLDDVLPGATVSIEISPP